MPNKSDCLSTSQSKVYTLSIRFNQFFFFLISKSRLDLYSYQLDFNQLIWYLFYSSTYLSPTLNSIRAHPLVIAAHPSEPNQFALGLADGGVHILEPLESEGKWGTSPPTENGAGPSTTSGAAGSDQPQR